MLFSWTANFLHSTGIGKRGFV